MISIILVGHTAAFAAFKAGGPDCKTPFIALKMIKVIKVGAYIYPPASYVDGSGKLTGKTVELLRAVLKNMGYEAEFEILPFKRCLETMKDGGLPLMLPCVINDERLTYMQYTEPLYFIDSVLWKQGMHQAACWDDFDDLKGRLVGATNGYAYGPEWDEAVASKMFKVDYVASENPDIRHFEMLLEGRADMFICERNLGQFIKDRFAPKFNDIHPCPKSVGPVRSFNAPISRKFFEDNNWDSESFLIHFNHELSKLKGPGAL